MTALMLDWWGDDLDDEPLIPDEDIIDEVAIGRACDGERKIARLLRTRERDVAIGRLTGRGLSIREIAVLLQMDHRTVSHYRNPDWYFAHRARDARRQAATG